MEQNLLSYTTTLQSINVRKLFSQDILSSIYVRDWRILTSWLLKIRDMYFDDGEENMLLSSLSLFHSFLTKVKVLRSEYHIYLCACCHISMSTYYDKEILELEEWTDEASFTKTELEQAIKYVVVIMEGILRYPTPIDVLQELKDEIGLVMFNAQLLCLALYFCDPKYIILDQEIVAKAACYFLSRRSDKNNELLDMINADLYYYFQYIKNEIFEGVQSILTVPSKQYEEIRVEPTEALERSRLLPMDPQYIKIENLGEGTFGTVTLQERNNERVAVKTQYIDNNHVLYIELHVLSSMKNKNIINMIDFHFTKDALNIELEPGSSLRSILYNISYTEIVIYDYETWEETYISCKSKSIVPVLQRRKWMNEICRGIEYLHSFGIIHRDIKLDNVIIVDNIAKISDFGSCYLNCFSEKDSTQKTNRVYTFPYQPVEIVYNSWLMKKDITYSFPADIWATGVSLLELETGFAPFMHFLEGRKNKNYPMINTRDTSKLQKLAKEQLMWCMATILGSPYQGYDSFPYKDHQGTRLDCIESNDVRKTILSMLNYEPSKRPSINKVSF